MKHFTFLASVLPLLLSVACVDTGVQPRDPLPMERIVPQYEDTYTGLVASERRVIKDAETFEAVWVQAFRTDVPIPAIDFRDHAVIVVAMGERGSGGFAIRVADVTNGAAGMDVNVELIFPGPGCAVTLAMTQPLDMVKVRVPSHLATFHDHIRRAKGCD